MKTTITLTLLFFLFPSYIFSQVDKSKRPKYEIEIKSEEYPIFSQAIFNGIYKYDAEMFYNMELVKKDNALYCTLVFKDSRVINSVKYYLSEYTMALIPSGDISQLNSNVKWRISTAKSLMQKLDFALMHPIKTTVSAKGILKSNHGEFYISSLKDGNIGLIIQDTSSLKGLKDKTVIVRGEMDERSVIETQNISMVTENRLEIYVMSLCPYGQRAISSVLNHLQQTKNRDVNLVIKYIFTNKNGVYSSLHGEDEVLENLVQIKLRNDYPERFYKYLNIRNKKMDTPWETIAEECGLNKSAINEISNNIFGFRHELIKEEYENNEKLDASPTFVWEGEVVKNISLLRPFKGIDLNKSGICK